MATLLLRLSGPMQAWGTQSRFRDRDSGLEPSKSGVIGLLCAALGRPRHADVADLAALRMGVRVDRPGVLQVDYQTVGANYPKFNKAGRVIGRTDARAIGYRYYLADASFLVGLEGDEALLRRLAQVLAAPHWQLYLGRKAFPPGEPIVLPDGLRTEPLEDALRTHPRLSDSSDAVRMVLDDASGPETRIDLPLSFAERRYAARRTRTDWLEAS